MCCNYQSRLTYRIQDLTSVKLNDNNIFKVPLKHGYYSMECTCRLQFIWKQFRGYWGLDNLIKWPLVPPSPQLGTAGTFCVPYQLQKGKECNKDVIQEQPKRTGEDFIISFLFPPISSVQEKLTISINPTRWRTDSAPLVDPPWWTMRNTAPADLVVKSSRGIYSTVILEKENRRKNLSSITQQKRNNNLREQFRWRRRRPRGTKKHECSSTTRKKIPSAPVFIQT